MAIFPLLLFLTILGSSFAASILYERAGPVGRTCGSEPSSDWVRAAESQFTTLQKLGGKNITGKGKIKVYWHVIQAGETLAEGNIPDSQIHASIKTTSADYAKAGLTLELASIDRTTNRTWFRYVAPGLPSNTDMKNRLHKGGAADLNVYTVGFKGGPGLGLFGYATFPMSYEANKTDDGVVIQYATLPGGTYENYNLGKTLTHEFGHWLGLYHTFRGDTCSGDGDYVSDTPPEQTSTYGCPAEKDTCPGGGPDPIHNFMDYSFDSCLYELTPGQIKRIKQQIKTYRGIETAN
ncbi:hypothetical protein FRC12_000797 [Ceratobasidium sp. 428]|nr:hypothetical protein FRC12_000797 [Ceratobasidium sp. 428]